MRLDSLSVTGFCHFNGRFDLNLRDLPRGLVAIVGPNGAGKTSLALDSAIAAVYGPGEARRAFPSREGNLSTYATSRDASIAALWHFEGRGLIRTRVNVDGVKRKTDAVIEEIDPDGVGHPLNTSGLIGEYKDKVGELFPSLRSLLASAYASQNHRGGFGDLPQTERIQLFVELADLAHYEEKSRTAKRCADLAQASVDRFRARLQELNAAATDEQVAALKRQIGADEESLYRLSTNADAVRAQIATLDEALVRAKADAASYWTASAERDRVKAQIATLDAQESMFKDTLRLLPTQEANRLRAVEARYAAALADLAVRRSTVTTAYETKERTLSARITETTALLDRAGEVADATSKIAELSSSLTATESALDAATQQLASTQETLHRLTVERAVAKTKSDKREAALKRSALLTVVKFGQQCAVDPVCPLVADAAVAATEAESLATIGDTIAALDLDVQTISGQKSHLTTESSRLSEEKKALRLKIDALEKVSRLADSIAVAQQRLDEYNRDLSAAFDTLVNDEAELDRLVKAASATKETESSVQRDEIANEKSRLEAEIAKLVEQREAYAGRLPELNAEVESRAWAKDGVDACTTQASAARDSLVDIESRLSTLRQQLVGANERVANLVATREAAVSIESKLRTIENDWLAWKTLATACGKDGLQRLEIDAAGPVVSDLANQLLAVGYGTRFAVDIVTQVETADKKDTKEKFTILVIDNDNGGEMRDISDLSGGERVIVEEAIRAALSCYVNLRSRTRMRTLWRDETTGALDVENAQRYVAMLRKLQDLSGAEQVLFITHSETCAALADAQVCVSNGSATVALPPYRG